MTAKIKSFFKDNLLLLLIILLYSFIIFRYLSYVQMWDGYVNLNDWLYPAIQKPFNLSNFDDAGHPTFLYYLILSVSQYMDMGNQYLLNLTVLIISILSIAAFNGIVKVIIPKEKWDGIFLTFLYAFFPVIIGNSLHITADYGMMAFFLLYLWLLLSRKYRMGAISSVFLLFTKEPAVILYLYSLFLEFIFEIFKEKGSIRRIKELIIERLVFVIPLIFYILRIIVWKYVYNKSFFYEGASNSPLAARATDWPYLVVSKIPLAYFISIFIINYNWILTLFMFAGIIVFYLRLATGRTKKNENNYYYGYFLFLFAGAVLLLTYFKTFTNLRYFLPLYPLLIILAYFSLNFMVKNLLIRRSILLVLCLLFFVTAFRTTDPVSQKIFGVFNFGRHKMLNMTTITHECCGYGRDQIVYNLEYTNIHYLVNGIYKDIKPDGNTTIAFAPWEGPYMILKMDKNSFERTMRYKNFIDLAARANNIVWNYDFVADKPGKIYFIEFPNEDSIPYLEFYKKDYSIESFKDYERNGYMIRVYTLKNRQLSPK